MAKPKQVNAANCRRPGPPPDAILDKPYAGLIAQEEKPKKGKKSEPEPAEEESETAE